MVEKISQLKMANPQKIKVLFDSQEELTRQMVIALRNGEEDSLIECIKLGERNLEKLAVVGKKAQSLVKMIEKLGGEIIECAFLIGLPDLKGRDKLKGYKIFTMIDFEGD